MKELLIGMLEPTLIDCGWRSVNQGTWEKGARRITFQARAIVLTENGTEVRSITYNPHVKELEEFGLLIGG